MKNILIIHQSSDLYGSDKTLLLLLKNIDKFRFLPVVVLPNDGPLKAALEKENIQVFIAPVLKLHRKIFTPKNLIKFFKELKVGIIVLDDLNKKYNFDVIYSNTLAVLLGLIYAKKKKIKHLWHVHEIIVHPKIIAYLFPRLLNKYADIIVCNSFSTKENLIKRIKQLEGKTKVIYNGIELNTNENYELKTKEFYNFNEKDIIITLVGRINRLKGHKLLLNILINNFSALKNVKILFVGSVVSGQEYYLEEIENIIEANRLQEKVIVMPFTTDVQSIWNITDIAIVPSTEAESFGLVAIEAMLAKKPVIGSNHGGLTEIIINNETGFLVEPNNEKEFTKALFKLIENSELRKTFGLNGYKRVCSQFSIQKHVSDFQEILNE